MAGLGNIYADEALWEARIHPMRRVALDYREPRSKALHRAIRVVLERGLKNLGTSLGTGKANFYSVGRRRGRNIDQLKVFRRTGLPCPRCGAAVDAHHRRPAQHARLCAKCQVERKPIGDRVQGSGFKGQSSKDPAPPSAPHPFRRR